MGSPCMVIYAGEFPAVLTRAGLSPHLSRGKRQLSLAPGEWGRTNTPNPTRHHGAPEMSGR